jgi:transglutaminase-like putative cysteine protease
MRLEVLHRTHYSYGDVVTTSHHEARLSPRDTETQRVISHELRITPSPASRKRRFDYHGNRAVYFAFDEPHRSLEVVAQSIVDVQAARPLDLSRSPTWESVRDRLRSDHTRDLLDAYAMTFDSTHARGSSEVHAFAAASLAPGRPLLEATMDLVTRVFREFAYDARATEISTPVDEVLRARRGVCQDFAHLLLAALRSHGLAARYVSGYLLTHPPPGKPKLVGADASHAWLQTFVPEYGWVDFDPTNGIVPSDEHVTVAYGRDFADVTPLRGVILGGGQHQLSVAVDVDPVAPG